jgi:hypothetical protein
MTGPGGSPPRALVIEDDEHLARLVAGSLARGAISRDRSP